MVVVIVKWYIKSQMEDQFIKKWESMKPKTYKGLFREFLNKPENLTNEKFVTLDIVNPYYTTFLNVGIWRSLEDFDEAIGKMIPERKPIKDEPGLEFYKVFDFEFKMRERIVLDGKENRRGLWNDLPESINEEEIKNLLSNSVPK